MLTTRKINVIILLSSVILRYFFVFYIAVVLAKCVWWVVSPARSDIYVEWTDPDRSDNAANYIINRYPFGMVMVPKAVVAPKPRIADKLKLTGVYLSSKANSIAFLQYESKSIIVKPGQVIANSDAILESISDDSIVVSENGLDATIGIAYVAFPATIGSNTSRPSSGQFPAQNTTGYPNNPADTNAEDIRSRRHALLDDFNKERERIAQNISQGLSGGPDANNTDNSSRHDVNGDRSVVNPDNGISNSKIN